jgi:hypothetical protein
MKRRKARALRRRYGHADAGGELYMVRYVHKISPSDKDVAGPIHLAASALENKKALGAALRASKTLMQGASVRSFRVESAGKVVVFPSAPGLTTYWYSIILTPVGA